MNTATTSASNATVNAVFRLPAVVTAAQASSTAAAVAQALVALAPQSRLSVDAQDLAQFDSSALAVLLQAQRDARVQGKAVQFTALPARLSDLAKLYGLESLIVSS